MPEVSIKERGEIKLPTIAGMAVERAVVYTVEVHPNKVRCAGGRTSWHTANLRSKPLTFLREWFMVSATGVDQSTLG